MTIETSHWIDGDASHVAVGCVTVDTAVDPDGRRRRRRLDFAVIVLVLLVTGNDHILLVLLLVLLLGVAVTAQRILGSDA